MLSQQSNKSELHNMNRARNRASTLNIGLCCIMFTLNIRSYFRIATGWIVTTLKCTDWHPGLKLVQTQLGIHCCDNDPVPDLLAVNTKFCFHPCYWPLLSFPSLSLSLCTAPVESDDFAFFHEGSDMCLGVMTDSLSLTQSCEEPLQRWKWVSRGRLFNLGSSLCLGLNHRNVTFDSRYPAIAIYKCDREPPMVDWTWNCNEVLEKLNNVFQSPMLFNVSSKFDSPKWRLYGDDQDLCSKTYQGRHHMFNFTYLEFYWCINDKFGFVINI